MLFSYGFTQSVKWSKHLVTKFSRDSFRQKEKTQRVGKVPFDSTWAYMEV
jgi:hypothetical protein